MGLLKSMVRETAAVVALFLLFFAVLLAVVGLAYYLKEFGAPAIRELFGVSGAVAAVLTIH